MIRAEWKAKEKSRERKKKKGEKAQKRLRQRAWKEREGREEEKKEDVRSHRAGRCGVMTGKDSEGKRDREGRENGGEEGGEDLSTHTARRICSLSACVRGPTHTSTYTAASACLCLRLERDRGGEFGRLKRDDFLAR